MWWGVLRLARGAWQIGEQHTSVILVATAQTTVTMGGKMVTQPGIKKMLAGLVVSTDECPLSNDCTVHLMATAPSLGMRSLSVYSNDVW